MELLQFLRKINDAQFEELIPEEEIESFHDYLREVIEEGQTNIVLRFLSEPHEIPMYIWCCFQIDNVEIVIDGDIKGDLISWKYISIYAPNGADSYVEIPPELKKYKYFSINRVLNIEGGRIWGDM